MERKEFPYTTLEEDISITADVYHIASTGSKTPAAIAILIYGGGFVAGSKDNVSKAIISHLVDELGFAVVVPNYRHCPTVSVFEGPIKDIRACYQWVHKKLPDLLEGECGIKLDGNKIVLVGSSAGGNLALHLVTETPRPRAIVAYFAPLYLDDDFWHSPMELLSKIPTFPDDFLGQVMNEGTVLSTPSSFKRIPNNPTPVPDFSRPRVAWLLSKLRDGTWLRSVVQESEYKRVDPTHLFSKSFTPTCFVHGTDDKMCLPRFSKQAHDALIGLGVDTKLLIAEGKGHDFETSLAADDPSFPVVRESLRFAADRV